MKKIIIAILTICSIASCKKESKKNCYTCKIDRKSYKQTTSPKPDDILLYSYSIQKCNESQENIFIFEKLNTKVETTKDSIIETFAICSKN